MKNENCGFIDPATKPYCSLLFLICIDLYIYRYYIEIHKHAQNPKVQYPISSEADSFMHKKTFDTDVVRLLLLFMNAKY